MPPTPPTPTPPTTAPPTPAATALYANPPGHSERSEEPPQFAPPAAEPSFPFHLAVTPAEIDRCFAVMHQLRPSLLAEDFAAVIAIQQAEGFQLAYLEHDGIVVSVAGFRIQNMLYSGKTLYVDDLSTDAAHRSRGHGAALLNALIAFARQHACQTFSLDSGTQRQDAHAFYLRNRLRITAFHFALPLT